MFINQNETQPPSFTDNFRIPSITDSGKATSKCTFENHTYQSLKIYWYPADNAKFVEETSEAMLSESPTQEEDKVGAGDFDVKH